MNNKEKYARLCLTEDTISVFSQPWWLDTVCGENNWDVVLFEKDAKILGSLPYFIKKKFGFIVLTSPKLTQTLGVWFAPSSSKYSNRLRYEKEIVQGLINGLPKYHVFFQCFHNSFVNWLPFYWNGFEQTTKITYVVEDLSSLDKVWAEINSNIKTDIRKAQRNLIIVNELSVEEFYRIISLTFQRQQLNTTYSLDFLNNVLESAYRNNSGKIFCAIDKQGRTHAVLFLIWDKNAAYYLIGGADPQLRNSGAASLCVWEAIKFASSVTKTFDFEGSMVEGIERFFRNFGAKQKPYSRIVKFSSIFLGMYYYYKKYCYRKI